MGITAVHRLPDGRMAQVDSDVLGVARRLTEGDPTLGWPGDPDLGLVWSEVEHRFEVWHTSRNGDAYLVCSHPTCDADLVRKVVAADNHGDETVFARIRRQNEELDAERRRRNDDWLYNHWIPKASWALRRDSGWSTKGSQVSMGTKR